MWEKAFRDDDGSSFAVSDLTSRADKARKAWVSAFSNSTAPGYEQSRSEMDRWTGTPEGTWNVLRMFRETHAISAIASSTTTGYEGERSGTNHWTDMTQGTRNESCGHIRKWTSALWAWVQLKGCEPKRHQQICWCPFCILTSLLIVSQISFECDCRFRLFYGVGQSLHYIYARSSQRSSLSIRHLQMS